MVIAKECWTTSEKDTPRASVVIVAYNTPRHLLRENLQSLSRQTTIDFETIVVDNSDRKDIHNVLTPYSIRYVKLQRNFGLSVARNVGIRIAKGDIAIFLDDDAIPAENFVEQHLKAYETGGIVGLRGKILPRTRTIYNRLTNQYDLGDRVFPYPVNQEGNSSFKIGLLRELEGFREDLAGAGGYEGAELSCRIVRRLGDRNRLIYYPGACIRHDFCGSFAKYVRKLIRHSRHREILEKAQPGLSAFIRTYPPPEPASSMPSCWTRAQLWLIRKGASICLRAYEFLHSHGR